MHHDSVIEVEAALALIGQSLAPVAGEQQVALADALGRVLIEPLVAVRDVPEQATAAMDGYALHGAAVSGTAVPFQLDVIATVLAGHAPRVRVGSGQCVRIMTGALLPEQADTVVMLEDTSAMPQASSVRFDRAVTSGSHVRRPGEQMAQGDMALASGRALTAADVQMAAMLGHASLKVRRLPRVAVFSSGDEVQALGTSLKPGAVYDSNRQFLLAALKSVGVASIDLGICRDERDLISHAIERAAACADLLITTGGASRGDADHVSRLLQERGTCVFAGVAMKPGRPSGLTLCPRGVQGADAGCTLGPMLPVLALPGSPTAMLTAFYVLCSPALSRLAGLVPFACRRIKARLEGNIEASRGRTSYTPARLAFGSDGVTAWPAAKTRAGLPGAALQAELDGLIEQNQQQGRLQPGDQVTVLLL